MSSTSAFPKERVERVAKMYNSPSAAAEALGIQVNSFTRLCQRYGIETPTQRKRRLRKEAS